MVYSLICQPLYTLWIMAELAIIGSDIQEVIGTAISLKILFGIPLWLGSVITICDTITFLFIHYCGIRKLEVFFIVLVGTMAVCFFIIMFSVQPQIEEIFSGFIPGIPDGSFDRMVGLIGAIIMPHNLFLHSALVLSREIDRNDRKNIKEANFYFSIEAVISLLVSFLISMSVVVTFAHWHLTKEGEAIELKTAHYALANTFGEGARIVWAIGLFAAGQSSTMTGTYSGQFVMQGFLNLKLPTWMQVALTCSIAIFPAIIVAFNNTMDDMDGLINIMQAIQLPFALIPLLKFTSSSKIMNEFKNHKYVLVFCVTVSSIIIFVNLSQVTIRVFGSTDGEAFRLTKNKLLMILISIFYFVIILFVIISPIKSQKLINSGIHASENCLIEDTELKKLLLSNEKDLENYIAP